MAARRCAASRRSRWAAPGIPDLFLPSGGRPGTGAPCRSALKTSRCPPAPAAEWSVELGCLEKLGSVDREDTSSQGLVFAPDLQHHFTARRAARPDLAPQTSQT